MLVRAVVFDFRDTILDVRLAYQAAYDVLYEVATERGIHMDRPVFDTAVEAAYQRVIEQYGRPPNVHDWGNKVVLTLFASLGQELGAQELGSIMARHDAAFVEHVALFPEAKEVLDQLEQYGIRMGVVIDGMAARERAIISRLGLHHYFDAVVISEEVGKNKFTPEPLRRALELLGVPASEVLVVGDRIDKDIVHANRLGCVSVKLERTGGRYTDTTALMGDERPVFTIHSLSELPAVLQHT